MPAKTAPVAATHVPEKAKGRSGPDANQNGPTFANAKGARYCAAVCGG